MKNKRTILIAAVAVLVLAAASVALRECRAPLAWALLSAPGTDGAVI